MWGGEGKEEVLIIKMVPGSRIFSSNVPRMLGFRYFYEIGEDGGGERKEEVLL